MLRPAPTAGGATHSVLITASHNPSKVALLVLGDSVPTFCAEQDIPLVGIARRPNHLWLPSECPLCATGMPLEDVTADSNRFLPKKPPSA